MRIKAQARVVDHQEQEQRNLWLRLCKRRSWPLLGLLRSGPRSRLPGWPGSAGRSGTRIGRPFCGLPAALGPSMPPGNPKTHSRASLFCTFPRLWCTETAKGKEHQPKTMQTHAKTSKTTLKEIRKNQNKQRKHCKNKNSKSRQANVRKAKTNTGFMFAFWGVLFFLFVVLGCFDCFFVCAFQCSCFSGLSLVL